MEPFVTHRGKVAVLDWSDVNTDLIIPGFAILLPRDVRFPAAMLGALSAGRGYVPLDVDNPIERNRQIAVRSGAAEFTTKY